MNRFAPPYVWSQCKLAESAAAECLPRLAAGSSLKGLLPAAQGLAACLKLDHLGRPDGPYFSLPSLRPLPPSSKAFYGVVKRTTPPGPRYPRLSLRTHALRVGPQGDTKGGVERAS